MFFRTYKPIFCIGTPPVPRYRGPKSSFHGDVLTFTSSTEMQTKDPPDISMGMVEAVEWEMLSGSPVSILSSAPCSGDW
jgi:hypothetical protein